MREGRKIVFELLFKKKPKACDANALLRQATELKDQNSIGEAIAALIAAFDCIKQGKTDYGVATFLRLPLYLQAANRDAEAWKVFLDLLDNGYPNQLPLEFAKLNDKSKVYDKMRLFLQRSGDNQSAILYGIRSYIIGQRACLLQGEPPFIQYFNQASTGEAIHNMLAPLLKKAGRLSAVDGCAGIVNEWVKGLPLSDDKKYEKEVLALFD